MLKSGLFLFFVCSIWSTSTVVAQFKATDCSNGQGSVSVSGWSMPDPIPDGGRYRVQLTMTVTQTIPGCAQLELSLCKKAIFGICLPFPTCADDFGTCKFNVCNRPGFPHYNPLFEGCQGSGPGFITPGTYTIDKYVYFPGLGGFESFIVDGSYKGTVTITNNGKNIGCWKLEFSVKKPNMC